MELQKPKLTEETNLKKAVEKQDNLNRTQILEVNEAIVDGTIADRQLWLKEAAAPFNSASKWESMKHLFEVGPGQYDPNFNHQIEVKGPQTFGSTAIWGNTLNRDIKCPYVDKSSSINPPVGYYMKTEKQWKSPQQKLYEEIDDQ